MITALTTEGHELRELVSSFLEQSAPLASTRRLADTAQGYDAAVWGRLCKELGLAALHLPEEDGGLGLPHDALTVVLEEMGRVLYNGPYFSTVCLGADAVLVAGTADDRASLLPSIAAGDTTATLAFAEADRYDLSYVGTTATPDGAGGFRLHGTKTRVVDGDTADLLVVVARTPGTTGGDGLSLFVVASDDHGVERTALPSFDQTRRLAQVVLDGAPARLLGRAGTETGGQASGTDAVKRVLRRAAVCLAAEQLGGAQACLAMAVGYAGVRTQFGRPVGGFQAVKHRCADMLVAVESARSVLYAAAAETDSPDAPDDELAVRSSMARAHCSEVFSRVATDNVHVHGGIGFTWEHDAQLFLKRAKSSEFLLGSPDEHRELVACALAF